MAAGVEKLEKEIGKAGGKMGGKESKAWKTRERRRWKDGFEKRASLINNPKSELPSNLVQRGSMANGMRVNTEAKLLHACFNIHRDLSNELKLRISRRIIYTRFIEFIIYVIRSIEYLEAAIKSYKLVRSNI